MRKHGFLYSKEVSIGLVMLRVLAVGFQLLAWNTIAPPQMGWHPPLISICPARICRSRQVQPVVYETHWRMIWGWVRLVDRGVPGSLSWHLRPSLAQTWSCVLNSKKSSLKQYNWVVASNRVSRARAGLAPVLNFSQRVATTIPLQAGRLHSSWHTRPIPLYSPHKKGSSYQLIPTK